MAIVKTETKAKRADMSYMVRLDSNNSYDFPTSGLDWLVSGPVLDADCFAFGRVGFLDVVVQHNDELFDDVVTAERPEEL